MTQAGCRVSAIDRLHVGYPVLMRLRKRLADRLTGTTYALDRSPHAVTRWSREASSRIKSLANVDAVVSTGTLPVAELASNVPLAIWADATFHSLRTTYPEFASYSGRSIDEGDRAERMAFARARLVCFASEWAAADAIAHYGVDRAKVRVVPFGANTDSPFVDEAAALAAVRERDWSTLRFLFIGVDWQRKGGDTAVEVVRGLNASGTRAVLSVVGCQVPADIAALPFVESVGFVSKRDDRGAARLGTLMSQSHFLLVPTRAECFGLVFAEASAFALPSAARRVGGTTTAIRDGETGLLFDVHAGADSYIAQLRPLIADRDRYTTMSMNAYRDYRDRLNWRVAGAKFVAQLRQVTAAKTIH